MAFSRDGTLLAVASGCNIDIWNVSIDSPQLIFSDCSSETVCSCITWSADHRIVITGHASGEISFITITAPNQAQGIIVRHPFSCSRQRISSLSLLDDRLLAVATESNVRLVEVTEERPVLLGHLPPPILPDGALMIDTTPRFITWVSDHEIAVCYSSVVIRWLVQNTQPLTAKVVGRRDLDGLLVDVSQDHAGLVAHPSGNQFKVISLRNSSSEIIIPRASGLPPVSLTSQAIFVNSTIMEAGVGCFYQWDLTGRKLRSIKFLNVASAWFDKIVHAYNPATGCSQVAGFMESNHGLEITLWKTWEELDSSPPMTFFLKQGWIYDSILAVAVAVFLYLYAYTQNSERLNEFLSFPV
ncbi:hypothetical protein VKT23_020032 [Stygiomarasmius scandens]|uniref:WD40 repeat-like protein n=1 Tax=Marasmiellus scandens TaxID=2682957 RepID=A0ABR1IJX5_9AGAR